MLEKNLKIVAINCFTEGTDEVVTVRSANYAYTNVRSMASLTPCSFIATLNENGETVITVSDPTQTYRNVILEIEIEGATTIVSADLGVNATVSDGTVSVTVNTEGALGTGFTFTVK